MNDTCVYDKGKNKIYAESTVFLDAIMNNNSCNTKQKAYIIFTEQYRQTWMLGFPLKNMC
jgi:hypothetical protein